MSSFAPEANCKAKKMIVKWRNQVLEKENLEEPMTQAQADKFVQIVGEKIVQKVLDSETPRLKMTCIYPIENFLPKYADFYKKSYSEKALFNVFPKSIEIDEFWHAFDDESVVMVAVANQEVLRVGRFLSEIHEYKGVKQQLGIPKDLGAAKDLISIAQHPKQLLAFSSQELSQYLKRRIMILNNLSYTPCFIKNMDFSPVGVDEWIETVERFVKTSGPTLQDSIKDYFKQLIDKKSIDTVLGVNGVAVNPSEITEGMAKKRTLKR